jgi:hypothetical protein
VKTWTSSVRKPARRMTAPPADDDASRNRSRPRARAAFLLAVVWVVVGAALYAAEVLRLVSGLG